MSSVELVLADLDGTIVQPRDNMPSEAVIDSISKVQNTGKIITAVTGRPIEMAMPVVESAKLHGLNIFDAGATIINSETGIIEWRTWLDSKTLQKIAAIILPHAVEVDFFPAWKQLHPDEVSVDEITEDAPYGWAFFRKSSQDELIYKLKGIKNISVHFGPGDAENPELQDVQITHVNADKKHAVAALRSIVHSDKNHTLAIGDSSNDLPLFECARLRIAMGNASERLKAVADYIVADVDNDGFAEAMDKFVLK